VEYEEGNVDLLGRWENGKLLEEGQDPKLNSMPKWCGNKEDAL